MLGLYVSVPFCRSKCSYCNFASDVFARANYAEYCTLLCREIELTAAHHGLKGVAADTVYWGGGTPSLLDADDIRRIARTLKAEFAIAPGAEFTVEVAPGTLSDAVLDALSEAGVNRVSLGVQSFQDEETRAVGRLHRYSNVLEDIARLRRHGAENINIDLIAGLPHQTEASWKDSLEKAIATGVPHLSVYMLEVDDDSRLGTELLAGGSRYHAHHVPDDDLIAAFYETACDQLQHAGIFQYEISNFARPGWESRHNERYWLRRSYVGFGVDAHSMLSANCSSSVRATAPCLRADLKTSRWGNVDTLERYVELLRTGQLPSMGTSHRLDRTEELEEVFFLGLRRNAGIDLEAVAAEFGAEAVETFATAIGELLDDGLLHRAGDVIRLTSRGRLLSNEVFVRFIRDGQSVGEPEALYQIHG